MKRLSTKRSALTLEERTVLHHAALMGYRFDAALLALAVSADIADLWGPLKRWQSAGIIEGQDDGGYLWKFQHALVHQTFVDSIPRRELRACHERILNALESAADSPQRLDQLAYHAFEAGCAEKARVYNERAGDTAFHIRALPEAVKYFEVALSSAPDDFSRIRLRGKISAAKGRARAPT